MQIITSYTVPIKGQVRAHAGGSTKSAVSGVNDRLMKSTADTCLEALKFCVDTFLTEWDYLSSLPTGQRAGVLSRKRGADILIHSTKDNKAKYPDFDRQFRYMPAYVRRAIIADALGMVSSYVSNRTAWKKEKPQDRGAEPTLGIPDRYELTFYKEVRDLCDIEKGIVGLKLYNGRTWGWYSFVISPPDAKYISKLKETRTMLSPVVEKVRGRYRIKFSFEKKKDLVSNENPLSYRIIAVDLGINAPASWCVMECDGTVLARGVIHLASDEDRLVRRINRKRMYQQAGKKSHSIYRLVNFANRQLSIDTSREIMKAAVLYNVDCIVFEYLDRNGKTKGKKYRERIHMWRANDVQKRVELQAHRLGMRISRVCAWGTSKLAFDGSGPVIRDKGNYSVCTFQNGKRYNCDLSAALNIGARFFLREYAKQKGCPGLPKTSQRTYATLRSLVKDLNAGGTVA